MPILTRLVQEAAVLVLADLASQESGAVFRCAKLCTQHALAVHRAIDSLDAQCGVLLAGIGNVDANTLIRGSWFGFADHNLFNVTILAEVFWTTQSLQQCGFIFDLGNEADYIDQVLLLDSYTSQIPPTGRFHFALLGFFASRSQLLLIFVELVGFELFRGGDLVLDGLFVVGPSAIGTGTLLVGRLQRVKAELAYLLDVSSSSRRWCWVFGILDNHRDRV